MSNVRRIYVEKKEAFAVKAKELQEEIQSFLGIEDVKGVRVLIRYDVENISDEVFARACRTVFSEPPVDILYEEKFETCLLYTSLRRTSRSLYRKQANAILTWTFIIIEF